MPLRRRSSTKRAVQRSTPASPTGSARTWAQTCRECAFIRIRIRKARPLQWALGHSRTVTTCSSDPTGAAPITNANAREFLSYAWEALDTTTPALTAAERVNHCNIAIGRYNLLSDAEKLTYKPTYDKLQALIVAGGVGNP